MEGIPPDTLRICEDIERRLYGNPGGFSGLIRAWLELVEGIDRGLDFNAWEFDDVIDCRYDIDGVLEHLSQVNRDQVQSTLSKADARFLAMTVPMNEPSKFDDRWNRIPATLGPTHRKGLVTGFGWLPSGSP